MQETWLDMTQSQAGQKAAALGMPAFRGRQIWKWLHQQHVKSYDAMTNLSKKLREQLDEQMPLRWIEPVRRQESALDETVKYLFKLQDGNLIESVLMKYHHGYTVCVSSQAGCRMGCKFCASTLNGLDRNLTAGEILQQIYQIENEEDIHVSNVVVMGCGEPFDNYENLLRFLEILHDPEGHNMSYRNMTVSTCGLLKPLEEWIQKDLPVTLAISLHAPNDEIRRTMMPIARSVSMEQLMDVCKRYTEQCGRRITFEYSLVQGVNDQPEHAKELIKRLRGMLCHVNLIPVNPVAERGMKRPDMDSVRRFEQILAQNHIQVTVRRELGQDIDGACGQLRRHHQENAEVNP